MNFRDYPDEKRGLSVGEVEAALEDAFGDRPFTPVVIETSLLNCYGLSAVSTFLHVPFLCLKRHDVGTGVDAEHDGDGAGARGFGKD